MQGGRGGKGEIDSVCEEERGGGGNGRQGESIAGREGRREGWTLLGSHHTDSSKIFCSISSSHSSADPLLLPVFSRQHRRGPARLLGACEVWPARVPHGPAHCRGEACPNPQPPTPNPSLLEATLPDASSCPLTLRLQDLIKAIRLKDAADLLENLAGMPQGRGILPLPITMSILTGLRKKPSPRPQTPNSEPQTPNLQPQTPV